MEWNVWIKMNDLSCIKMWALYEWINHEWINPEWMNDGQWTLNGTRDEWDWLIDERSSSSSSSLNIMMAYVVISRRDTHTMTRFHIIEMRRDEWDKRWWRMRRGQSWTWMDILKHLFYCFIIWEWDRNNERAESRFRGEGSIRNEQPKFPPPMRHVANRQQSTQARSGMP